MKTWSYAASVSILALGSAISVGAQAVTFDFDTGAPTLSSGQTTPIDQTASGLAARFSSPSGAAFSIQSDASTGFRLSQFSGKYLYSNNINGNVVDILLSQPVAKISLTFATADFQQVEVPTTLQLTAYRDSTASAAVGSASAHGTYGSDTMPMGKLSFDSGGLPFNVVQIAIAPGQPLGAAAFLVDNVVVTLAGAGTFTSMSAASFVNGGPLAANAISSGFGLGLATGTASAASLPLPTVLANTSVTVTDSAGVGRPAPLFYVSPSQINYLVPDGTATGPATVTVKDGTTVTSSGALTVNSVSPALFTANFDGKGAPAAEAVSVAPDLTFSFQAVAQCGMTQGSCVTSPIDLGPSGTLVALCLYGTGIRGLSSPAGVTVSIGGLASQVLYAGPQYQYVGLDQVNVIVPTALAGRGEVDLNLTVDGKAANTVRVNIQ